MAALRAELAPDGAMPTRVALDVGAREAAFADRLVQAATELVRNADGRCVRLFVPGEASWATDAAARAGFRPVRTIAHMLMPADAPTPPAQAVAGIDLRPIGLDEDEAVLAALNHAWAGTWNFVSIAPEMLAEDLREDRAGMLLGVDASSRIVATCHAVYVPTATNPDGAPRAWISNLTVAPEQRGRGVARMMLAAGIASLRGRGATSITLGVDADNPAPFQLYQSVGFRILSRVQAWDANLRDA